MRRATTPVHTFVFPFPPEDLAKILLTYAQDGCDGGVILNKTEEDFVFEGNVGKVTLTQEETSSFIAKCDCCDCNDAPYVQIQIRAKTTNGQALSTDIWRVPLKDVLNDEVL